MSGCFGKVVKFSLITLGILASLIIVIVVIAAIANSSVSLTTLPSNAGSAPASSSARTASVGIATVKPLAPATPTVTPTPVPTLPPGMSGVDTIGIPYKLIAPEGVILNEWVATEMGEGGLKFDFSISTAGRKFDSDLTAGVSYYDSSDTEIGSSRTMFLGSMSRQDRDTRTYSSSLECEWGSCPDILDKASYYAIEFDVDLIDLP
jgi:hypothetical protein